MGVEAVLQAEQHLSRLAALTAANDVAEVVESFDAGSGNDQRFGGRVVVRGERVRRPGRHNQQVAGARGDDVVPDQQVERAVEDVEQLGGMMQPAFILSSVGYLAGGVLFGIALFRARVLARWASGLLVLGTLATLAIPMLPHSFQRPLAVPVGVALIGLGISLWRDQRKTAVIAADGLAPARVEHASVR